MLKQSLFQIDFQQYQQFHKALPAIRRSQTIVIFYIFLKKTVRQKLLSQIAHTYDNPS